MASPMLEGDTQGHGNQGTSLTRMTDERATVVQFLRKRLSDPDAPEVRSMCVRSSLVRVKDELQQLISSTAASGTNSSLLILGEPGVGKTLAVDLALAEVLGQFNTDPMNPAVGVVRLDGSLHVNDRAAFQEIARQLCRAYKVPFAKAAAYSENLTFLRDVLKALKRINKTSVFVVDNVDQFALQSKQTLLYNLLDILHTTANSAVVLGVSRSHDMHQTMEKRAYSRFSNRRLVVVNLSTSDGETARDVLEQQLLLPENNISLASPQFLSEFNAAVRAAVAPGSAAVVSLNKRHELQGCGPSDMAVIAQAALLEWSYSPDYTTSFMQTHHIEAAISMCLGADESQADMVCSLSVVELYVLVAMFRLEFRGHIPFSFKMVWDELQMLRHASFFAQDKWPEAAVMRAFQRVVQTGLASWVGGRAGRHGKLMQYDAVSLCVSEEDIEQGMDAHPHAPRLLRQWVKNQDFTPADMMS